MKKKIYLFIGIITFAGFLGSCSKDYLETVPTDSIAFEDAIATTDNLFVALNGIHRSLYIRYASQGEGGVGGLYIINDMLGEDLVMTAAGNGWYNNIYKWIDHRNANDADLKYPYRVYYRFIGNANVIINNIDEASGPDADKPGIKGQALFYRAWSHYQLVQLYAKRYDENAAGNNTQLGIPIMIENTVEGLPRSTVEQVYAQINDDIDEAITLLDGYSRANKSHINVDVARGLKARVALTMGDYVTAETFAHDARQGYTLADSLTYTSGFNNYNISEWMWGSSTIEDQNIYFADYGAYMSRNFSSTNIRNNPKAINRLLYNMIPATDARKAIFDPTGLHLNLPAGYNITSSFVKKPYTSQKFLATSNGDSRMDLVHMRASEMYLIEAEAIAKQGGRDAEAAQVLYEMAVVRDPAYTLSTNTGTALIDEILIQRRWELWGEGFRFLDLKRLNMALDRTGSNHSTSLTGGTLSVPAGDVRWEWLIPQSELDANPAMEGQQNPLG